MATSSQGALRAPLFAISAEGRGDTGTFDAPNAGLGVGFAYTPGALRVELAGEYWLQQTSTLPPSPPNGARGGRFDLAVATLTGCYAVLHLEGAHLDVGPCAGAELGLFQGKAFGVSEPGNGTSTWVAFRSGGLGTWRFAGPLALRLDAEAVVPFTRPMFEIGGVQGVVHRPATISGRAGLGVELRF